MKEFKSLSEAFNYRIHCPVCSGTLEEAVSNSGVHIERRCGYSNAEPENIIVFQMGDLVAEIDYDTGRFITLQKHKSLQDYHNYLGNPIMFVPSDPYKLEAFGIRRQCPECCSYDYVIQVHLSMEQKKVINLLLNSETITITNDDGDHEIRNSYATEQTEYWNYANRKSDKTIQLPLITLDLEYPEKTLQRIHSLISFS